LPGIFFTYDQRCLTNGTGGDGTESTQVPRYSFFYNLTGGSSASEWTKVKALSLTNHNQGTVVTHRQVGIIFPTALTNHGIMYFRWADDNCVAISPDQMIAIDNIGITVNAGAAPVVTLTAPANDATFIAGTNIFISATASEDGGTITN